MKATEKGLFCYHMEDGRTALTQRNLEYALDENGNLDLAVVKGDDAKRINIIADPQLGFLLAELYGKDWLDPEVALKMSEKQLTELPYYQHCAVMSGSKIYVRDGKFIPLEKFTKNASPQELAAMLWDVAAQAALAQLSMISENTSALTKVV